MCMVSIFVFNDVVNDLFLGLFFFFTSVIGMIYFTYNPYFDQRKQFSRFSNDRRSQSILNGLQLIENRIQREVYMQKLGQAQKMVCFLTVISFSLMLAFLMNSQEFAV